MRHREDELQKACVRWFRYQFPGIIIHHSPNGGRRNAIEGAKFKEMGTLAGFPDLIILSANKGYGALFIELKSDKGRQSECQKRFQEYCENRCYAYSVVRSVDDFVNVVRSYLTTTSPYQI